MAARRPSKINTVAEALVEKLRTISAKLDHPNWLTNPRTIKRGFGFSDSWAGATPAILLSVAAWSSVPKVAPFHQATVRFEIHLIVEDPGTPSGEDLLNSLASDVIRLVQRNEVLDGLVETLYAESYELNVEAIQRSGKAVATLIATAQFEYDHNTP